MTEKDVYLGCTMGELYVRAIRRFPDRIALVDENEQLTYREMGERVCAYGAVLLESGLQPGDALAQLSTNSVDAVCVIIAASLVGLRYTPLHPLGSEEDHAFILEDAEIDCLIVDQANFAAKGQRLAAQVDCVRKVLTFGPSDFAPSLAESVETVEPVPLRCLARPDEITAIVYTGGTTGKPKGVVHLHRSIVTSVMINMCEFEWPREIRFLAVTPVSHAALGFILPVLLQGGTFIMQKGYAPESFLEAVENYRVTVTFMVPTMIYVLLDCERTATADIDSLETIIYGASPMSPARMLQALDIIGPVFQQLFGQTESPNTVTALLKHDHDPARDHLLLSCGQPLVGIDVRLFDDDGREVSEGETGELCVRGPLVMDHYWKRPEETAETLADGWLHTGDMAYMDEGGYIYLVDRKKDLVISGGFNVFPREVEDILNAHPGVSLSSVIGIPDEKWGEAVKAIVVKQSNAAVTEEELIRLVKDKKGAVYAPKTIEFVDSIPLTPLGKPDKKAIRARYWEGSGRQVG